MTPIFKFKKVNGRIIWDDGHRATLEAYKNNLSDNEYELVVRKKTKAVSLQQHRYYRGPILTILGEELGYLPDEIHHLMGQMFLQYEKKGRKFIKSTARLTTKEMTDFIENVRRWAAMEMNIITPTPDEVADYE